MFLVFLIALISQVVCDTDYRSSYIKKFKVCRSAEFSHEIEAESESDCILECIALHESGGCEAYQWNGTTGTCFIQDTLNMTPNSACSDVHNIGVMLPRDLAKTITCPEGYTHQPCDVNASCELLNNNYADCAEILVENPTSQSGVYEITPAGTQQIKQVWCDMDTDGGGWTVFLKRIDGSVDFYQNIAAYTEGFGDVCGEYWLGLDALHAMTSAKTYQIRADMSDWDGASAHSLYASMVVADASDDYRLTLGAFLGGEGGNGFLTNQNMFFTTYDAERDKQVSVNCAVHHTSGFWYNACSTVHPTSKYYTGGPYTGTRNNGIQWRSWSLHSDSWYSLKTLDMKLRP